MRAAVIGAGWGQHHVRALRSHGVDVVALGGAADDQDRTSATAARLGIPAAIGDPAAVLELGVDLVTIATPAPTHAALLTTFRDLAVVCEKPILGMTGDPGLLPSAGPVVWVNYAFAFLDVAQQMADQVQRFGPVRAASIRTAYDLPLEFSGAQWLLEVASHPLSFVVHLLGQPRSVTGQQEGLATTLTLDFGIPVDVTSVRQPGLDGITHSLWFDTDRGRLSLTGQYRHGQPWRYGPVRLNGDPVGEVEASPIDCWERANRRSFGAVLESIRGGDTDPRLFNVTRARLIDDPVRDAFAS